jgi:hypothetical protein
MAGRFSGPRVALTVLALVVLTAVLPPAGAYALAQWRIARAQSRADSAVAALGRQKALLQDVVGELDVVCGPGRFPGASAAARDWLLNPVAARTQFGSDWPTDPWGRCYLLNVRGVLDGGSGLLISAGPNSTIDTPLTATTAAGDDIAATVR